MATAVPAASGDQRCEPYGALLLSRLVLHARRVLAVERACVMLVSPARPGHAVVAEAQGVDDELIGRQMRLGAPLRRAMSGREPQVAPPDALFEPLGAGRGAAVRIAGATGVGGVLCVARADHSRPFDEHDHALLPELATLVGTALEDVRMGADLGRKVRACSGELARLAETAGCGGLAALTGGIGRAIGLDPAALIELELAALLAELHGGAPAQWELALMPGFQAVGLVLLLAGDGDGYPYGLTRDRIPIASRILSGARQRGLRRGR